MRHLALHRWPSLLAVCLLVGPLAVGCGKKPDGPEAVKTPTDAIDALSAEHTLAVASVRKPYALLAQYDNLLKSMPSEARKDMPEEVYDPAKRAEAAGIDFAKVEGWKSLGIDGDFGLHVIVDDRMLGLNGKGVTAHPPVPVVALKITDMKALQGHSKRWGVEVKTTVDGAVTRIEASELVKAPEGEKSAEGEKAAKPRNTEVALMVEAGGMHLVAPVIEDLPEDKIKAALTALAGSVGQGQSLGKHEPWQRGLRGRAEQGLALFCDLGLAHKIFGGEIPPRAAPYVNHALSLFPAASFYERPGGPAFRLVATEAGRKALQKLFVPNQDPVPVARYVSEKGLLGLRLSINLKEMPDGVEALFPPDKRSEAATAVSQGKMLLALSGFTLEDLSGAFSGHLVATVQIGENGGADPLESAVGRLGFANREAAIKLVSKMVERAVQFSGGDLKAEPYTFSGHKGHLITAGPVQIRMVATDDALLIASRESALKKGLEKVASPVEGPRARILEGRGIVQGSVLDVPALIQLAQANGLPVEQEALEAVKQVPWLAGGMEVDGDGLVFGGDGASVGFGAAAILGIAAAVAIPAFLKYIRRSKSTEARLNLRRMSDGARAYFAAEHAGPDGTLMPRQFPPSTALSPVKTACEAGESTRHAPSSVDWDKGTWRALNFAMNDSFYYQYQFVSEGTGAEARFTARALGDLDCDGVLSTFEMIGVGTEDGEVNMGAGLFLMNETE